MNDTRDLFREIMAMVEKFGQQQFSSGIQSARLGLPGACDDLIVEIAVAERVVNCDDDVTDAVLVDLLRRTPSPYPLGAVFAALCRDCLVEPSSMVSQSIKDRDKRPWRKG